MSEFRLIAMPYELDRLRYGVGRGPERLLEAGAAEALAGAGRTLQPRFVELSEAQDSDPECDREGRVPPIALAFLRAVGAHAGA